MSDCRDEGILGHVVDAVVGIITAIVIYVFLLALFCGLNDLWYISTF